MLTCPNCSNEKTFACDIKGIANYNQETNEFNNIRNLDINDEAGIVTCKECGFSASVEEFEN